LKLIEEAEHWQPETSDNPLILLNRGGLMVLEVLNFPLVLLSLFER
jgi:hypothetical protein